MPVSYTHAVEPVEEGICRLTVTWWDGDTEIVTGTTHVRGDASVAEAYARVFAQDLRRNFAERFPAEQTPNGGIMP